MTKIVKIPEGGAVIVGQLGSKAIITSPHAQDAVVVELGGSLNKTPAREPWSGMFLFSPEQTVELVADLILTGGAFTSVDEFLERVATEIERVANEERGRDG